MKCCTSFHCSHITNCAQRDPPLYAPLWPLLEMIITMSQGATSLGTPFTSLWRKIVHSISNLGNHEALGKLGDFTTSPRVILISGMAVVIGVVSAFIALILLRLIGLFTNLFF